jgi:hypothetical protein
MSQTRILLMKAKLAKPVWPTHMHVTDTLRSKQTLPSTSMSVANDHGIGTRKNHVMSLVRKKMHSIVDTYDRTTGTSRAQVENEPMQRCSETRPQTGLLTTLNCRPSVLHCVGLKSGAAAAKPFLSLFCQACNR